MRVLLDLTHPAHLHVFRPAIARLRAEGHALLLTGRDKDVLAELAAEHGLALESFGGHPRGVGGMAWTLLARGRTLARIARRFRPDVMAAVGGTFVSPVGRLLGVPVVIFYDTESARLSNLIAYPPATRVCVPASYAHRGPPRAVRYAGCHELAYLDPRHFTPSPATARELGVAPGEAYVLVRLVGWSAGHDLGRRGLALEAKLQAVERLRRAARVFVSSEGELPASIAPHRFPLPASRMHDALAGAALVVGESTTMCSEAACLGVPSVLLYPRVELGLIDDLARRGLVHWFAPTELPAALEAAERILREGERARWRELGARLRADSIDVTDFICRQLVEAAGQPLAGAADGLRAAWRVLRPARVRERS